MAEHLSDRKQVYVKEINVWRHALKAYTETVKLDHLRIALLREAGVANTVPEVRQQCLHGPGHTTVLPRGDLLC